MDNLDKIITLTVRELNQIVQAEVAKVIASEAMEKVNKQLQEQDTDKS